MYYYLHTYQLNICTNFIHVFHAKLQVNEKQIKRWRSQYREQEVSYHIFPDIFPPLFFGLANLYWTRLIAQYINLKYIKVLKMLQNEKENYAVTRIRTWVASATTKSTNHYTITATEPLF